MEADAQLVFGPFRLDSRVPCLWRGEHPVELQPRPLAVLRYLAERPGQLVTKAELLKHVWAGIYVTKAVLKVSIHAIREALGDDATAPVYIETVGREGYRFLGGVQSAAPREENPHSASPADMEHPTAIVVGRDRELAQLHGLLVETLQGHRQVVFVTGEPGVGKTTLVDAFLQEVTSQQVQSPKSKVQEDQGSQSAKVKAQKSKVEPSSPTPSPQPLAPRWWVGRGQCVEQYGQGEAYLPMLEALGQLCRGPGGKQMLAVLQRHAPTWLVQMPAFVAEAELETFQRKVAGATRERMLREMAEALEALTEERGLVLVLEDLHVSDRSTVELLAYLAQRRERAKLLVIGTYRPTDVVIRNHPLKGIKQELSAKRQGTELQVELLSRAAVDEYVARRLAVETAPATLTHLIYQRTDGNALFMVNVLDYCLQHGLVVQEVGQWKLRGDVEALGVPESVQQMIVKQCEGLGADEQRVLELASVVGSEFAVAAVAAALPGEINAVEDICEELADKSHFLHEAGVAEWPDGTLSGRYTFRHVLYQNVMYGRIAEVRRVRLHRLIGERQEQAYGTRAKEIAAELAMHFERGRDYQRAVFYLREAGDNAIRRSAYREAIRYLTKGLALLNTLPENSKRTHQEISLQLTLGLPLAATKGYAAPEVEQVYARALALCGQVEETPLHFSALVGLWAVQLVRGKLQSALGVVSQGLRLAEEAQNPAFLLEAHLGIGMVLYFMGELRGAYQHLAEGVAIARTLDRVNRVPTSVQDSEVACLTYAASALWHLGYADQARAQINEARALARALTHPFSEGFALTQGAGLYMLCGDRTTFRQWLDAALSLAHEQGFPLWIGLGTAINGGVLISEGKTEEGMAQVQQGLAIYQAIGTELSKSFFLLRLADAHKKMGQTKEGLALLQEVQAFVESTGERLFETDLYRLRGELTLAGVGGWRLGAGEEARQKAKACPEPSRRGKNQKAKIQPSPQPLAPSTQPEAEEYFRKAIAIAQQQQAKSLELRAVMSLVRLRQHQVQHATRDTRHEARPKLAEAHRMLSTVYTWFTEGFDTKDLQEAKALLEELSH